MPESTTSREAPEPAAPAVASLPAFEFNDGAHEAQSLNDPNAIYKALVEHSLRSRWNRPEDFADDNFVAEVEVTIDHEGNIENTCWVKGSGNKKWDDSVKASMTGVKAISRPRPKAFLPPSSRALTWT